MAVEMPDAPDLSDLDWDEYADLLTEVEHIKQERGED